MPLIREVGGGGFVPAGRHKKALRADLFDGIKPSWLTEDPGAGGGAATFNYLPLSATSPGIAQIINGGSIPGGWNGPEVDLAAPWLRAVWFTAFNVRITRPATAAVPTVALGIRSTGSATAGARVLASSTPPSWPTVECLVGGGVSDAQEMRMPWGSRGATQTPTYRGDSPRNMTFHIDVRDKTVSVLMDDQVLYSRQRPDLVLGLARPNLVLARPSTAATGDRTLTVTGFEFGIETNGN